MKKFIFYCIFIAMTLNINAQVNLVPNGNGSYCRTPSNSSNLIELENIRGLDHVNDLFRVKLYVHLLRKQQAPKYGQSIENVNRLMKVLYDDYDPLGIYFVWDGEIDYIDNTNYFEHPFYYTDPAIFPGGTSPIFNTNNHTDGIDIYLFDELLSQDQPNGFGLANGIGESTELIVGGYWFGDKVIPLSKLKVISHEMGHVLYLWHTHHGTYVYIDENGNDWENDGDPNSCAELVNPATDPNDPDYLEQYDNKHHCGDYIYDTPADPNLLGNMDGDTCNYTGTFTDANGDTYQPNTGNLMSYTYPTCLDDFTFGQKSRMKNALWYLPVLNQTILTDYTYIRADPGNGCFICTFNFFTVYTSHNASQLSISSSSNILVETISQTNNTILLQVTSLLDQNAEGEQGYINISYNNEVISQPVWVGKPQTLPDNVLSGTETVYANQEFNYGIGLDNRLKGIDTYEWVFPEPYEEIDIFYSNPNPNIWQYIQWSKYFVLTQGLAGNQTGIVRVHGLNPCGPGGEGIENEICVLNISDPEGDTNCDSGGGGGQDEIIYYPNPADDLLAIDLSLQDYKVYTVVIYDQYQTVKYSDQSTNVIKTIDVFNLSNGTYYLHIYDDNGDTILSRILIINH